MYTLEERIENLEKIVKRQGELLKQLVPVKDTPAEYCRYALFGLQQVEESEKWGSWIENYFIYLGEPQFRTEKEALDYLNGDVKNMARDHYLHICSGKKLYLYDKERNRYNRLRRTPEDKYYLKVRRQESYALPS